MNINPQSSYKNRPEREIFKTETESKPKIKENDIISPNNFAYNYLLNTNFIIFEQN